MEGHKLSCWQPRPAHPRPSLPCPGVPHHCVLVWKWEATGWLFTCTIKRVCGSGQRDRAAQGPHLRRLPVGAQDCDLPPRDRGSCLVPVGQQVNRPGSGLWPSPLLLAPWLCCGPRLPWVQAVCLAPPLKALGAFPACPHAACACLPRSGSPGGCSAAVLLAGPALLRGTAWRRGSLREGMWPSARAPSDLPPTSTSVGMSSCTQDYSCLDALHPMGSLCFCISLDFLKEQQRHLHVPQCYRSRGKNSQRS